MHSLAQLFSIFAATSFIAANAHAAVRYVNANLATGGNDGTSWADAYRGPLSLQTALTAAQSGDEIWVVAGIYLPGPPDDITSSFVLRNGVGIYGGFIGNEITRNQRQPSINQTILSGDVGQDDVYGSPVWYIGWNINTPNSMHVINASGVLESAALDGFTITAGRASSGAGGGMYNIGGAPAISNCTFWRNLAAFGSGGAIYNQNASPTITNCTFSQNWVHLGQGGAMYNDGNGAIAISDCLFTENRCTGDLPEAAGGAISNYPGVMMTITRCTFNQNAAQSFYGSGGHAGTYGGAIHHMGAALTVTNSIFTGNFGNAGGAIWTWRNASIINCLFRGNQAPEYQASQGGWGGTGGAIATSSFTPITVNVINCTIVSNTAKACGGFRAMADIVTAQIHNCIFWNNSDEFGTVGPSQIRGSGATYCDIHNMLIGIPGEDPPDPEKFPNCIDVNPQFVNMSGGDLHVMAGSPCIDAGANAKVPPNIVHDLDGHARLADGDHNGSVLVDLGAYEVPVETCIGDITGDQMVNVADLLSCINSWGACPAPPGACPADVAPPGGDGTVNVADLLAVINAWGACP